MPDGNKATFNELLKRVCDPSASVVFDFSNGAPTHGYRKIDKHKHVFWRFCGCGFTLAFVANVVCFRTEAA